MSYKHAGEVGDVWKHLPLCDILAIERPLRYHETNSAYSGYTITRNPKLEYGIFKFLDRIGNASSEYSRILKENGIDEMRYTGSPGLAMGVLGDKSTYFFHDIEAEALEDINRYALSKGLKSNVQTFCGDSVQTFLSEQYHIDENDFLFIDPYSPFDNNESGNKFFDVFEKSLICKSKTLLWYGYDRLTGKKQIIDYLRVLAEKHNIKIWSFDLWLKFMTNEECKINPGVPGCGLACANLSDNSVDVLKTYLQFVCDYYSGATYCGDNATLLCDIGEY